MATKPFSISAILRRFKSPSRKASLSERENVLTSALNMTAREERRMAVQIQKRYIAAYQDAVQGELNAFGLDTVAKRPTGTELATIKRFVKGDVDSILQTYQRESENFVRGLLKSEPNLSPSEYKARLRAWQSQRWGNKIPQIELSSRGNGANYGRERFNLKNNLTDNALFIWDASPPIVANSHQECIRRVNLGEAQWEGEAETWDRPHPNCRHTTVRVAGAPPSGRKLFRG